jgi:hypothetical protein
MPETFVPKKPEKYVEVKITAREANLIKKLRKHVFGQFTVYKQNDLLIRIEIRDSQIIDEEGGIDLT